MLIYDFNIKGTIRYVSKSNVDYAHICQALIIQLVFNYHMCVLATYQRKFNCHHKQTVGRVLLFALPNINYCGIC